MPEFPAQRLAQWTGGRWTAVPVSPLSGFCVDTRTLRPGQVFVALKTDKRDGHDFLAAAHAAGAAAALVATPNPALTLPQLVVADPLTAFQTIAREHRRLFTGPVIGISGSAGKTSTKDLLGLLLGGASADSRVLATHGNLNNHLGVPLTLTRLDTEKHDFAVIEAGISAPGEMGTLAAMIEPDVALITLIAPAHTEELGGLEGVAREKAVLPAATRTAGVAVFSRDTAAYPAFRALGVRTLIVERCETVPTQQPPKNTVYFTLTQGADQTEIVVAYGAPPPLRFTFRRVSDGMAQNAVLAICAALWLGVAVPVIADRLAHWEPAKLRGEIRHEADRMLYLDCYNANPASMADALQAFDAVAEPSQPRLYVIGCMEELGEESARYHRELGRSLRLRSEDLVFFIGAQAEALRSGALEGGATKHQVHVGDSVEIAAQVVRAWRGAIFVKGSRRYQLEKALDPVASASPAAVAPH